MAKPKQSKFKKDLKACRKASDRHVLVLETDMSHQEMCRVFHEADLIRKMGNELTGTMKKNFEQLMRTKRYRKILALYGKCEDEDTKDSYKKQLQEMQAKCNVTWDFCRQAAIPLAKKYGIDAVYGLTKAEDVWSGVEKCLYSDGKTLHFAKKDDLPCIRAKQINRGIIFNFSEDKLSFKIHNIAFCVRIKDRFQQDEVDAMIRYMKDPKGWDKQAVQTFRRTKKTMNTYRPCYASLVCQKIRGRMRVFLHITIEGRAMPKYDGQGDLRHSLGTGAIGCDIGTQTIAYCSDKEAGLKNLAERGPSIMENERKERRLLRAMDRSKRATNPQNYNANGTIKKGKKTWKFSNRYKKLKVRHAELCRVNALNRHLAINEEVNHLRSLGNVFITEPKNAKKLQRKAKPSEEKKTKRRKRFGKSIKNRCPGYFQAKVKQRFTGSGGKYIEAPNNYRASQYDHTADEYIKKKLSDRMYSLSDGTKVQRDWYSSFLLYCMNIKTQTISKQKCKRNFRKHYEMEKAMIEQIIANKTKVLNIGIKIA